MDTHPPTRTAYNWLRTHPRAPLTIGYAPTHAQPGDADDADEYHEMLQYRFGGGAAEEYDEDYYYGLQDRLQGSSRAVGNRRWGEGGFVQGGRKAAKAKAMAPPGTPKAGKLCAQPCSRYADPAGGGAPKGKGLAATPSGEGCGGPSDAGASGASEVCGACGGAPGSAASSKAKGRKAEKELKAALKERQKGERREMALSSKTAARPKRAETASE